MHGASSVHRQDGQQQPLSAPIHSSHGAWLGPPSPAALSIEMAPVLTGLAWIGNLGATDSSQACRWASRARRYSSSCWICSSWKTGTLTIWPDSATGVCAQASDSQDWANREPVTATIVNKPKCR